MMVVSAGRIESRLRSVTLSQSETEHTTIERELKLQVRHLDMDVANSRSGCDGIGLNYGTPP